MSILPGVLRNTCDLKKPQVFNNRIEQRGKCVGHDPNASTNHLLAQNSFYFQFHTPSGVGQASSPNR
jgi:hypothetical protein